MICPHGQLDDTLCPECSLIGNVKPLARASKASFTDMEIRRVTPGQSTGDIKADGAGVPGNDASTTTLRLKRVGIDGREDMLLLENSGNLHERLQQVLGRGFEVGMLDENVERRVKQIQKRETNPRAKLE